MYVCVQTLLRVCLQFFRVVQAGSLIYSNCYNLLTQRRASKDYKRSLQRQVSDEVLKNVQAKKPELSTPSKQFDLKQALDVLVIII